MFITVLLVSVLIVFSLFASFIIQEQKTDERADVHISLAGRNAFLAGSFVLMVGIDIQGYSHS